ncbi:hypothetical protein THAOC_22854 [Thalassiosira oceanica]|uniref:Uncharacterized protein n=1 Tax=Thalassiosira oceanica TaxID=159749 RepID=K0S8E5_THAOC|nr:hypothetical protein THAOC_22854 [Thalassiosira oceanica]|eukprot:EJK57136.1 hypothetical protein THAOC_22854 [Thalassiosira oceanica]
MDSFGILMPLKVEQTTQAESASGPDGDDNGPDQSRRHMIASAISRCSCRVAGGRRKSPSFAYSPVDYLPHDVLRPDEPTDFRERYLLNATPHERSEDNGIILRNAKNNAIPVASARWIPLISSCSLNNFGC